MCLLCLQMRSVASWLAFLLDVSADLGNPCTSLADSSWSSSAEGLMLCELPAVGEKRNHHPLPTTQDKSLFVISPPFPCFSAFPHILFFRCCSIQSPFSACLSQWLLPSSESVAEEVGCSPLFSQTSWLAKNC